MTKPADAPCPRCQAPLGQIVLKNVTVDRCEPCDGLWFDSGELTLKVEVVRPLTTTGGKPTTLPCPRCDASTLADVPFPGTPVQIFVCGACHGAWLDKGKLDELKAALRAVVGEEGKSPSGDRTAALVEEFKKIVVDTLCPKCRKPVESEPRKSFVIERCPACRGIWYDSGELTADLGISRKISIKDAKPTDLLCPHCPEKKLVATVYPKTDVELLVCPDCRGNFVEDARLTALRGVLGV